MSKRIVDIIRKEKEYKQKSSELSRLQKDLLQKSHLMANPVLLLNKNRAQKLQEEVSKLEIYLKKNGKLR